MAASRVAYRVWKGAIPDGMFVCHTCDVKRCINPDHLWLGTNRDNIKDAISKGVPIRPPIGHGENNSNAKITDKQRDEIRRLYANGQALQKQLANKFGITQARVSQIVREKQ